MKYADNVADVAALPINWIGFIFYEKSQRFVSELPNIVLPHTQKIGVFVNEKIEIVLQKAEQFQLDKLQLHGNESPQYCAELVRNYPIIKAFSVDDSFDFEQTRPYLPYCSYFLFDTKGKNYGGNGVKFNWNKLQEYHFEVPFLLSGGITPEDAAAVQEFKHKQLAGIDLNSGFEIAPAQKDAQKLKDFLSNFER